MSAQPNISSILASLAGPPPNGRPPYPPQIPPQPQPYNPQHVPSHPPSQTSYPTPFPSAPPSIPQPNGSGMINLSDIKPSHSGSVSLTSAPPAHQMPYPVPVRSTYTLPRSRSRSPQRSTLSQRNSSHNLYREERRMDPHVPYIREHQPNIKDSPGRGYSPLTGRRIAGVAQASSADTLTQTVMIDSSVVGLVIGRQGENMRRLEADTRTRIQFAPNSEKTGSTRRCTITGSKSAIDYAIHEINRTIEENDKAPKAGSGRAPPPPDRNLSIEPSANGTHKSIPRKEESTTIIHVPSKTVGLVIGKGGESIKNLQDRSHCHVNIMPEEQTVNGLRPVHLIGTPQQAAVAQDLIMEIVHTDSKKLPDQGVAARDGVNAMALGVKALNDKVTDCIIVPSEAVGMIIGKGGETIRDMQDSTNCKINVSQPSGRDIEREIELIGSRSAIQQAKAAIMEKVRAVQEKNSRASGRPLRNDSPFSQNTPKVLPQSQQPQPYPYEVGEPPGGHEAYAAYGGYQNYVALWYASTQRKPPQSSSPPNTGSSTLP